MKYSGLRHVNVNRHTRKDGIELILDGYDLIGDEYVRMIPLLLEKEINKHVETNIPSFFNKMGYKIKKIPTTGIFLELEQSIMSMKT